MNIVTSFLAIPLSAAMWNAPTAPPIVTVAYDVPAQNWIQIEINAGTIGSQPALVGPDGDWSKFKVEIAMNGTVIDVLDLFASLVLSTWADPVGTFSYSRFYESGTPLGGIWTFQINCGYFGIPSVGPGGAMRAHVHYCRTAATGVQCDDGGDVTLVDTLGPNISAAGANTSGNYVQACVWLLSPPNIITIPAIPLAATSGSSQVLITEISVVREFSPNSGSCGIHAAIYSSDAAMLNAPLAPAQMSYLTVMSSQPIGAASTNGVPLHLEVFRVNVPMVFSNGATITIAADQNDQTCPFRISMSDAPPASPNLSHHLLAGSGMGWFALPGVSTGPNGLTWAVRVKGI